MEVTILGHAYPIRITGGRRERDRIRKAVSLLNERLDDLAEKTGEVDGQHLAVMAALALASDLFEAAEGLDHERADEASFRDNVRQRTRRLLELVNEELEARVSAAS